MSGRQHGFALITAALALLVVAGVALLLVTESGRGQAQIASDVDRAELEYLTEAGVTHARWQLAQNTSCSGYAPVPATAFGAHSYNASFDPDSGSPVRISLTGKHASGVLRTVTLPAAKVFEPSVTEVFQLGAGSGKDTILDDFYADRNWGGAANLPLNSGSWVQRPILQFDLSALPSGVAITSATLELQAWNVNTPGVVTAHRLTRGWQEGTRNGGGTSDGADWLTYDGSNPWSTPGGEFDPTPYGSTLVASATWTAWEIRDLVQGWVSGEFPNNGLLLNGDGVISNASFAARETNNPSDAPKLTVTYACECGAGESGTLDLQPGSDGEDAYLDDASPATNWGTETRIRISEKSAAKKRGLMRFDLSALPPVATVVSAVLDLNLEGIGSGGTATVFLHRAMMPWQENQVTWNDAQSGTPWSTPGGDYDASPVTSAAIDAAVPGSTTFPITDLAQGWVDDPSTNHGLVLVGSDGVNHADFTTGDSTETSRHPRLTVAYTCPCGAGCGAAPPPPAAGSLLLVVSDATAPSAEEDAKRALIESWGYTVTLIDDNDAQGSFDTATAANDVAYVTSQVDAVALSDKLVNADIGVVNESMPLAETFGFDQGYSTKSRDQIRVVDNGHDITAPLALGYITITTSAETFYLANHGTAQDGDAAILSDTYNTGSDSQNKPSLMTMVPGDAFETGAGTAAGRRVQLPWGDGSFAAGVLNADGRGIMQRAIEWAATKPEAPTVLLVADDAASLSAQEAAKKALMESWGYTVALISDHDAQADFDAAVATSAVAYVSHEVHQSDMGSKLVAASIGVVNEDPDLYDEFGLAESFGTANSQTDIDVIDASHHITSPFVPGTLPILTSSNAVTVIDGSFAVAPGLQPLAQMVSGAKDATLAVLDAGAATWDGGLAAGRRVQVPWGYESLDINSLTDNGRTLMQRSLQWGAGEDSGGGGGGGPSSCIFRDEFETPSYGNQDGNALWAGDWQEINDTGSHTGGDVALTGGGNPGSALRVQDDNKGISRALDLSGQTSVTLTFDYKRISLESGEYVAVSVFDGSIWHELAQFGNPPVANDSDYQSFSADISAHAAAGSAIRFLSPAGGMGNADDVNFDNVQVEATGGPCP